MAEETSRRTEFISDRILEEFCTVMDVYFKDGDLMFNVVRTYSKISVHNDVCMVMSDDNRYFKSFVDLLKKYMQHHVSSLRASHNYVYSQYVCID